MYICVDRDILDNDDVIKEEFIFPVLSYILSYGNKTGENITTVKCILETMKITETRTNCAKVISTLDVLNDFGYITINKGISKIKANTPFKVSFPIKLGSFFVLHDYEIVKIVNMILAEGISHKVGIILMIIKSKSKTIDIHTNNYEPKSISYAEINKILKTKSKTTISKYVNSMKNYNIFKIQQSTDKETTEDGLVSYRTKNTYSFITVKQEYE